VIQIAVVLLLAPVVLGLYCCIAYPLILARVQSDDQTPPPPVGELPRLTIVIAAHNAARVLAGTLRAIVAAEYPVDRRSVIVVSDGSRDDTARVVREFRAHNVHLLQSRRRRGKTSAENLAASRIDGEIVVCMDANVRIDRVALRALVREFSRSDVGVVSGLDVAVAGRSPISVGERAYVRAEMWLRQKESASGGIVGASGCFYAVRRTLFMAGLRPSLTRDFAAVLLARRAGLRTVVATDARCRLHCTDTARVELARKIRTMVQGMETLAHFRDLLNPVRYGRFALALISHKLCRWMVPPMIPPAIAAATYLCMVKATTPEVVGAAFAAGGVGLVTLLRNHTLAFASYAVLVQVATIVAWARFLSGHRIVTWTPTPRRTYAFRAMR
jgi:hypothetical protein